MATWADVERIALALPETSEGLSREQRHWRVKDKGFVWERPLRRSDLEALGDSAPDGPILGVRVEHLMAKDALLADDPDVYFTTPHFDGYPAVLVRLERISVTSCRRSSSRPGSRGPRSGSPTRTSAAMSTRATTTVQRGLDALEPAVELTELLGHRSLGFPEPLVPP